MIISAGLSSTAVVATMTKVLTLQKELLSKLYTSNKVVNFSDYTTPKKENNLFFFLFYTITKLIQTQIIILLLTLSTK